MTMMLSYHYAVGTFLMAYMNVDDPLMRGFMKAPRSESKLKKSRTSKCHPGGCRAKSNPPIGNPNAFPIHTSN